MEKGLFEVSASWMKACGKGKEAKVFSVVRSYMAGHMPFVVVREDNGHEWVVNAEWRGKFV